MSETARHDSPEREFDPVAWNDAVKEFGKYPARWLDSSTNAYVYGTNDDVWRRERRFDYKGTPHIDITEPPHWSHRPKCNIIAPVGLMAEPRYKVERCIDMLIDVAEKKDFPLELTLFVDHKLPAVAATTARLDSEYFGHVSNIVAREHQDLIEKLSHRYHNLDSSLMHIKSTMNIRAPGENFNEIRQRSTMLEAMHALDRRFPVQHVFVWLDIDTPFVGVNALPRMVEALENREAHFVRGNLILADDNPEEVADVSTYQFADLYHDATFFNWSDWKAAAGVYGLARQMIERNPEITDPRDLGYVDESTIASTFESWLISGGPDTTQPEGESKSMLARAQKAHDAGRLDQRVPVIRHLKDARIGNSFRRYAYMAQLRPPQDLPDAQAGADYVDSLSIVDNGNDSGENIVTSMVADQKYAALLEMVDKMDRRQMERSGHILAPELNRRLENIIFRISRDIRHVRPVDFDYVLEQFDDHLYKSEFYEWTRELLVLANDFYSGEWHVAKISPALAMNRVTLMRHQHNGPMELVPPTGSTVTEAASRLQDYGKDYAREHEKCVDITKGYVGGFFENPVILASMADRGFTLPEHEQVVVPEGNYLHLDGLHRMLARYAVAALNPGRDTRAVATNAYIVGRISDKDIY
jgi:hypothetical protein